MIRGLQSRSPSAAASTEEYSDYFATERHYLSVVGRVTAALRSDGGFVLVTGDPPAASHLLTQALRKTVQSRYTIIDITCNTDLTTNDVRRARSVVTTLPASTGPPAGPANSETPPPLFVLADVDQLSDLQLKDIVATVQPAGQDFAGAVLLARSAFLIRLKEPALRFLQDRLAARFDFQEIGADEGIEFLRHQLAIRASRNEARGIPAGVFRGLAVSVPLLAIGVGAILGLQYYLVGKPSELPALASGAVVHPPGSAVESAGSPEPLAGSTTPGTLRPLPQATASRAPVALVRDETAAGKASSVQAEPDAPGATSSAGKLNPTSETGDRRGSPLATEPAAAQFPPAPKRIPSLTQPVPPSQRVTRPATSPPDATRPSPSSTNPPAASTETAALMARGDAFLSVGDIASSRLFYERAAEAGDGSAALRLGATFDPDFLGRAGLRGLGSDPAQAASWYRRALELGEAAASDRLRGLTR